MKKIGYDVNKIIRNSPSMYEILMRKVLDTLYEKYLKEHEKKSK